MKNIARVVFAAMMVAGAASCAKKAVKPAAPVEEPPAVTSTERMESTDKYTRESLDTDSPEFTAKLATLRREVESHAEAEETQEFPRVTEKESPERLEQMGKVFAAAKKAAPTRPHPSMPNTPVANMLAGPFAAVLDRTRDAVRDAMKSTS